MYKIIIQIVCIIIEGFVVKWLWNWIMPYLFGLPIITFWMSLGIVLLIRILNYNKTFSFKDKEE